MQKDLVVKGRSLGSSSDLTLLATIRPGFIESLESVSFKTRIKRVLDTLHGARMAAHEHLPARLLSDTVERVAAIHSVRVAVLEPEDKVLLAVTFDGPWQAYIRVLWEKVGTLLDLIFVGTVGYVTAREHRFEEWLAWARHVQVETGFFYGPDSSARDALYHRRTERMRQRGVVDVAAELHTVLPSAEEAVQRTVDPSKQLAADDPQLPRVPAPRMVRERVRNGLQGLAVLYRLADLHRPGTAEGEVLRHAALDMLAEFVHMRDRLLIDEELARERGRFARQLDWLFPQADAPALAERPRPPLPPAQALPQALRSRVQAGILRPYPEVTHGALLLLGFEHARAVSDALAVLTAQPFGLASDLAADTPPTPGRVYRTLAFTPAGLRQAGLDEDTLALFPEEFRQGMAARAGLLGDVRHNHPRRWRLPRRFVAVDQPPGAETVDLDAVHAVLQLRCLADRASTAYELHDSGHPLQAEVTRLLAALPGTRVLAVQPLRRRYRTYGDAGEKVAEHFGYADGEGQPEAEWTAAPGGFKRNRVLLGELLHGHANAADEAPDPADPQLPAAERQRLQWLADGSFMVLRKYRQFVDRLERAVGEAAAPLAARLRISHDQASEIVYAHLMGRHRDGQALIPTRPDRPNAFTYDQDPAGRQCPLTAHVRRAHPRLRPAEMVRPPRLMRRSMSYGPPVEVNPDPEADRGLVFMAFNASLAEQFEVVQRWLAGGNATGSSSTQPCPIVGVPENGLPRHFRFEYPPGSGEVVSVQQEATPTQDPPQPPWTTTRLFEEPPVPTQLEWGLYLFTPALPVLQQLRASAERAAAIAPALQASWPTHRGHALLAALKRVQAEQGDAAAVAAWKAALEDPEAIDRQDSAALWAAIREAHGGILRTPYGVLLASTELVGQVYLDSGHQYSVCGQFERMKRSFGEISLGLDAGPEYDRLAKDINAEIMKLPLEGTHELAFEAAQACIRRIVADAIQRSREVGDARFEAGFDLREVVDEVLGALCDDWFGLQDDGGHGFLQRGSADWAWHSGQPPLYPGHFTALSRYMFQPHPGPMAVELGQAYGVALRAAMRRFVEYHQARKTVPQRPARPGYPAGDAPIAKEILAFKPAPGDGDIIARTLVGVLMGFNPTIIGAVLNVGREWHREGRLADLRAQLAGRTDATSAAQVLRAPMEAAARMRPMPQIAWRTALTAHRLGPANAHAVDIVPGDLLVLGIVAGTQQALAEGQDDGALMFGGVRRLAGPHPTHACPGRLAGIGAMLGTLTAALTTAPGHTLRPGAQPLTFIVEGSARPSAPAPAPAAPATAPPPPARQAAPVMAAPPALPTPLAPPAERGLVLAWGDSWTDFSFGEVHDRGKDLRDWLETFGYTAPATYCKYSVWPKARTLAAHPEAFCADLDAALLAPTWPMAILLSAGGNDSTKDTLKGLINPKPLGRPDIIDEDALTRHIADIRASYVVVLDAILAVFADHGAETIPIVVHGYDHPIPQGKGAHAKDWLFNPFQTQGHTDLALNTAAMQHLIRRLNDMFGELAASPPYRRFVRHVDLQATIQGLHPPGQAGDGWEDDLHPTTESFHALALKVDHAIRDAVARMGEHAKRPAKA